MSVKFTLSFIFLACIIEGKATVSKTSQENVKKTILTFMKEYGITGVVIAIYADNKPYLFHYGYADKVKKIPVTKDTLFEIGSISKIFTCLLVALEINAGRMKLSDPISMYIKSLESKKKFTLELICTHTSGLPFDTPEKIKTHKELFSFVSQHKQPLKPKYEYSNIAIELLRYALEEQSGQPIQKLLTDKILLPLKMAPIGFTIPQEKKSDCAIGYDKNGKQTVFWDHPLLVGSGGIRMSNPDMLKFLEAALALDHIPTPICQAMRLTQSPYVTLKYFKHGLGWQITPLHAKHRFNPFNSYPVKKLKNRQFDGNAIIDKDGTTHGFHAYIAVIPNKKAGIAVMINGRLPHVTILGTIAKEILMNLTRPIKGKKSPNKEFKHGTQRQKQRSNVITNN